MNTIFNEIVQHLETGQDAVLVTIVEVHGSTPTRIGDKMLVISEGIRGTVGGGALEKLLMEKARILLSSDHDGYLEKIATNDIGMECGGHICAFMEPLRSGHNLWIFGGGHIAKALVPMVEVLGFRVTVVDNRKEFATEERFNGKAHTLAGDFLELISRIPQGAFCVIMTHGHHHDKEILKSLAQIEPKLPYIGMIGSKQKVSKIINEITAEGVVLGGNLFAPIGLKLGGNSPAHIALSIASEIQAISQGKTGLPHCRNRLSR
jgi:xanthine dehydrogenase accessory factor